MNAFTTVLIIIVLVLSAVFAGSQVMLYQKRDPAGETINTRTIERDTAQQELAQTKQRLETALADITAVKDAKAQIQSTYQTAREQQDAELATRKAELATAQETIQKLSGDMSALQEQLKDIRTLQQATVEKNVAFQTRIGEQRDAISERDTTIAKLMSEMNGLNAKIAELLVQRTKLAEGKKALEDEIADMVERGKIIRSGMPIPNIDAFVVNVSEDNRMVVISKGSRDGVVPGLKFTIYDNDQVLGIFHVNKVLQDTAAGPLTVYAGSEIASGNRVTTKIR